jgi:hypothetical protein
MRQKITFFLLLTFTLTTLDSCDDGGEQDFAVLRNQFAQEYFQLFPDEAPVVSMSAQSGRMFIASKSGLDALRRFYEKYAHRVSSIRLRGVAKATTQDYLKIRNILRNVHLYLENYQHTPQYYNCHASFRRILDSRSLSTEQQLEIVLKKLQHVPALYEAAKINLESTTYERAETAVQQQVQTYMYLDKVVIPFFQRNGSDSREFQNQMYYAKLAIKDYVAYCRSVGIEATARPVRFKSY